MVIYGAFTDSGTYTVHVDAKLNDVTGASGSIEFFVHLTGLPLDHSAILMKPLVVNIPKGATAVKSSKFLADDIVSFEVEVSDGGSVVYDKSQNNWLVSSSWD